VFHFTKIFRYFYFSASLQKLINLTLPTLSTTFNIQRIRKLARAFLVIAIYAKLLQQNLIKKF
jgi:hypothetical protein